jgi:HK97 family phage major capsid protein
MPTEAQWAALDHNRREALQRSLSVSSAGSVLLQTNINKVVQQLTLREFGLQAVLDRKPGSGNAAYINRRSAGSSGGVWVADTDAATEETGSYAQVSFGYKTLLTRGRVTRKVQATARSYGDALATELIGKSEDFANALEDGCMNGDARFSNQFSGALTLVNAQSGQVVANSTLTAGGAISLSKLDEAIDRVRGAGNRSDLVIVASFNGARKLNAALQAQQQFTNMTEIAAGFRVRTYDTIPIVISTALGNTMTWSGSSITDFANGSTTAYLIINRRYMWLEELTPTTVMPLAKSTSQYDEFDMFADLALVYGNTLGAALLGGISGS